MCHKGDVCLDRPSINHMTSTGITRNVGTLPYVLNTIIIVLKTRGSYHQNIIFKDCWH